MTSPFPLFHIPYLPLGRIIDFMEPKTLVSLSFCSQKSHSVIKTQRKAPFDGHLLVGESDKNSTFLSFTNFAFGMVPKSNQVLSALKFVDNINYEGMESVKMGGRVVRVEMDHSDGYLISYWKNTTEGSKVITDYVTNLFNIDVSDIWASKQSFHIIQHVISRQKTPLRYFPKIDCLDINDGKWVSLDNLLTMDGIDIIMGLSTLTSSDVNVFLKHWLSGGCPRLKLFCAETGALDIFQVLAGLLHNAVLVENSRDYTSPFGYSRTLSFGYDIQRADGVRATVHYQPPRTLVIAVWPETTYNYN
ncbi:hypothetical protein CRE_11569 [Caenorhabditis remanei]|uniref:F-box domain-containing protein n=1 Tax=Caenorhabditis remanei TaxID=31234 RepID=E3NP31_CAERE|nr:hypothetical protein CRE_11569 [Caenorhabditis remanei]